MQEELIFDNPEIEKFIQEKGIKPIDFRLIEKLASFPKELLTSELNHLFSEYGERIEMELNFLIRYSEGGSSNNEKMMLYKTAIEFLGRYNAEICIALINILEER